MPEVFQFYADEPGLRDRELALVGVALRAASPTESARPAPGRRSGHCVRSLPRSASGATLRSLGFDERLAGRRRAGRDRRRRDQQLAAASDAAPMDYLEHYLDMVASIEGTAAKLNMPIRIEGYEPPRDYRMERLVVSPDPGVIEVNIHPSKTWKDLVHNIDTLLRAGILSRLGTEKFMLDGRHTGTGGATISLLVALHRQKVRRCAYPMYCVARFPTGNTIPGLSYLFSSAFIGPTSQAPRIDEGRDEKLYEMEIAFEPGSRERFYSFLDRRQNIPPPAHGYNRQHSPL